MAVTKANDFLNVAETLRECLLSFTNVEAQLEAVDNFYDKNSSDSYWTSLAGGDEIGTSGISKDQFIAAIVFFTNLEVMLNNGTPTQGDYRSSIEQARATS